MFFRIFFICISRMKTFYLIINVNDIIPPVSVLNIKYSVLEAIFQLLVLNYQFLCTPCRCHDTFEHLIYITCTFYIRCIYCLHLIFVYTWFLSWVYNRRLIKFFKVTYTSHLKHFNFHLFSQLNGVWNILDQNQKPDKGQHTSPGLSRP